MIGYNAQRATYPPYLKMALDLKTSTLSMSLTRLSNVVHRASTALKISNSHTVAEFFGSAGKSHDSLKTPATALVYEQFLEFDQGRTSLKQKNFSQPSEADLSSF